MLLHHPPLRIGVLHGHQIVPAGDAESLSALARAMDADILITGHTHRFETFEFEGRFFVNPGSATGAWHSVWPLAAPEEEKKKVDETKAEAKSKDDKTESADAASAKDAKKETGDEKEKASSSGGKEKTEKKKEAKATSDAPTDAKDVAGTKPAAEQPKSKPLEPAPGPTPSFARESAECFSFQRRWTEADYALSDTVLDIQGTTVVTYIYQLINGEVKVEKVEYDGRRNR